MKLNFRNFHLINLLKNYEKNYSIPLDVFVSKYFREVKSIGSKDRKEIANNIFNLIRWKELIDSFFSNKLNITWEDRFELYKTGICENSLHKHLHLPIYKRLSCPKFLWDKLENQYGEEKATKICLANNSQAPITIRINILKISRDKWVENYIARQKNSKNSFSNKKKDIKLTEKSPYGVIFFKKDNFFIEEDFKKGFFEVQDEGSQLISLLVDAKPYQKVLDYCAGSGGKTLAFGPLMKNMGVIYLHDIRENVLKIAKKRLKRSGIQNAQICYPKNINLLNNLKNKMDWVLVDVPCSGTGTLRRNPDLKWKLNQDLLNKLIIEQRKIFHEGLQYIKNNGKIVYSTCSILKEENEEQIKYFQLSYNLKIIGEIVQTVPKEGEMDGFFGVVLSKF